MPYVLRTEERELRVIVRVRVHVCAVCPICWFAAPPCTRAAIAITITIAVVVLVGCGKTQKSDTKIENQLVKTVTKSSQSKLNTSKVLSCCNSIHEAAANGKIDAVKAYLNAGADVNERDSDGLTPLHLVEKKEIAELLIAKGAELNPIDNFFKYTPLDFMEGEVV